MSTFRDSLGEATKAGLCALYLDGFPDKCADAILAMPEMQAIRSFCEWFAHRHGSIEDMRRVLADEAHLPESVIDWVVDA